MRIQEAQTLALQEMAKWDLLTKGWIFAFDQRKRRFGSCAHLFKRITLSAPLTLLNPVDEVLDTIRHEIAHALAGHLANHGFVWKQHCVLVGCRPEACYDSAKVAQPDMKYEATCRSCGRVVKRDRLPRRVKACGGCCKRYAGGRFSERFVLNFYRTGTQVDPTTNLIKPTAVQPPPTGQLSIWSQAGNKYVPAGPVTHVEITPPPARPDPTMRLDCFDAKMCVYFYEKHNMKIVDIAVKMGYKRGHGQNRVRKALLAAGVYQKGKG